MLNPSNIPAGNVDLRREPVGDPLEVAQQPAWHAATGRPLEVSSSEVALTRRYSDPDMEHAEIDIDPAPARRDGVVAAANPGRSGDPESRVSRYNRIQGR